jgi:putative peptide zinc metalloprotease protein
LENSELEYQRTKAWGELQAARIKLSELERIAASDPDQVKYMHLQEDDVKTKMKLYAVLDDKYENLTIRSPIDGVIFRPPPKDDSRAAKAQEQLPSWSGDPFDPVNSDIHFQEGDLICLVAPNPVMEGVMIVDQHDRDLLQVGDKVSIMLESARLESVKGNIVSFSTSEIKEAPPQLAIASGGTLDTKTDETGRTVPMSTSYQVRVALTSDDIPVRPSYRGEARVHLQWRSLGWRLYRYCMTTFNFEF